MSQSLSSKLTCKREMAHKALAHSSECVREGEIDGSQDSWPLAHSSESAQEREIWAHKALGLLLTAQRASKREKCGLTRQLASCSQLSGRSKERERFAHKASDLNQTVLTTVKYALIVLNTGLACCRKMLKKALFVEKS